MPSLRQIKDDPSLVDQRSGCCGFAAALMALLARDSAEIDELVDCVTKGSKWKDIDKSTRVRDRLIKRLRVGIIPPNQPFDFCLCLALMILFKEHAKQTGSRAWDDCMEFSQVWSAWSYSTMQHTKTDWSLLRWLDGGGFSKTTTIATYSKLKDVPKGVKLGGKLTTTGLAYKKGDMAMPADRMPDLLEMVGLTVQAEGPLVGDRVFRTFEDEGSSFVRPKVSAFHRELNRIQRAGSASSVDYADLILGLGNEPGNSDFEAYQNVTHWVYVPAKPKAPPVGTEFKCWTWGGRARLLDVHDR